MKTAVVIVIGALVVLAAIFWIRSRTVPTYSVAVREIPRVLAQLSSSSSYPAFAVFMFTTPDQPGDDNAINIQFSLENGHAGFDWVLLGKRNIKDKNGFIEFARAEGYSPELKEMNRVKYLRVDRGNLAALCRDVITKMYHQPEDGRVDLIVEGFDWRP